MSQIWTNNRRYEVRSYPNSTGEYTAEISVMRARNYRTYGRIIDVDGRTVWEQSGPRELRDTVAETLNALRAARVMVAA